MLNNVVHHEVFNAQGRGSTLSLSYPVIQDQLRSASRRHQTAVQRVKKRRSQGCHALDSTMTKATRTQCDRRMYKNTGYRWETGNPVAVREKGRHLKPPYLVLVWMSRSQGRRCTRRVVHAAEVVSAHANT